MPRYDYRCTDCEQEFELTQSFSEAGTGTCPVCSGAGRRLYHAGPVIYKGSGFYTTDYGRPKPPVENGSKQDTERKEITAASSEGASGAEDSKSASSKGSSGPSESKDKSAAKAASEDGS